MSVGFDVTQSRRKALTVLVTAVSLMLVGDIVLWTTHNWIRDLLPFSSQWMNQAARASFSAAVTGLFVSQLLLVSIYTALGDGRSVIRVVYTKFAFSILLNIVYDGSVS